MKTTRHEALLAWGNAQGGYGQKVYVYRNLTMKCWSVRAASGPQRGKVVAHCDVIVLEGALFRVNENGRQKVLRERKKCVHAGVQGTWSPEARVGHLEHKYGGFVQVGYNPYRQCVFAETESGATVVHRGIVEFRADGTVYASAL